MAAARRISKEQRRSGLHVKTWTFTVQPMTGTNIPVQFTGYLTDGTPFRINSVISIHGLWQNASRCLHNAGGKSCCGPTLSQLVKYVK